MLFKLSKKLFIQEKNIWEQMLRNSHQKIFWNNDLRPEYFAIPNDFLQFDILVNMLIVCIANIWIEDKVIIFCFSMSSCNWIWKYYECDFFNTRFLPSTWKIFLLTWSLILQFSKLSINSCIVCLVKIFKHFTSTIPTELLFSKINPFGVAPKWGYFFWIRKPLLFT